MNNVPLKIKIINFLMNNATQADRHQRLLHLPTNIHDIHDNNRNKCSTVVNRENIVFFKIGKNVFSSSLRVCRHNLKIYFENS